MHMLVRELACFSCDNCRQMKWRQCLKTKMCGHVLTKDVCLVSQPRSLPPLSASRVVQDAKEMAAKVKPGMIVGVECACEQKPYVILEARSAVYEYEGDDGGAREVSMWG